MIKSNRTKRRKTQEELSTVYSIYSNSNEKINFIENKNTETDNISINESFEMLPSCNPENTLLSTLPIIQSQSNYEHIHFNPQLINCAQTSLNESVDNQINTILTLEDTHSFREELSIWAVQCNVPHATVDKLLKLMKKHTNINTTNLPLDSRTLLNTPSSNTINIRSIDPGQYSHFGLTSGILRYALSSLSEIKIAVGIDGPFTMFKKFSQTY